MQQVAVCGVNLSPPGNPRPRPVAPLPEASNDSVQILHGHHGPTDCGENASALGAMASASSALRPGMRQLDGRDRSVFTDETRDAAHGLGLAVVPQPQVLRADPHTGSTAVASTMIKPAPPTARLPKCTKCQSVATPSFLLTEYWHIGETHSRFADRNGTELRG